MEKLFQQYEFEQFGIDLSKQQKSFSMSISGKCKSSTLHVIVIYKYSFTKESIF